MKIIRVNSGIRHRDGSTHRSIYYFQDLKWLTTNRDKAARFDCKRQLDTHSHNLRGSDPGDVTIEEVPCADTPSD